MRKKALLFDLDDTLLDFTAAQKVGLEKVFEKYRIPLNDKNISLYQQMNHQLWARYEKGEVPRTYITDHRFAMFFEAVGVDSKLGPEGEKLFRSVLEESKVEVPGARHILEELQKDYSLNLITNGVLKTQETRLKKTGLDAYFDYIFISDALGAQKPDLRFFEAVEKKLPEISPNEMLIIGDSLTSDIKGGVNAGIDTVWLNRHQKENNGMPTYEITELDQLKNILEKIS